MGTISKELPLNSSILKQCREQMTLTLEEVGKKVKFIAEIEKKEKLPTYQQLDTLANLYQVPRWVFISEQLPEAYNYSSTPSFRTFKNSSTFKNSKVRSLLVRVEQYRDLLLELKQDLNETVPPFQPPEIDFDSIENTASAVRSWLALNEALDFPQLKQILEQKNIFVFLTGKYKGWSHIDTDFRGLCIKHDIMPIIIINDSDSKKAQSFTLMHELGHLLRGTTSIYGEDHANSQEECWCDGLAGELLMPKKSSNWAKFVVEDESTLKKLADSFKTSPYACLVRLRQLGKITQQEYDKYDQFLTAEYERNKTKLQQSAGGPSRHRDKEVLHQFGSTFTRTVMTAWHNQDLTMHKVVKIFDLKHPKHLLDLQNNL